MNDVISSDIGPTCPYCYKVYFAGEDWDNVVTYWGDEGPKDFECVHCGFIFRVHEIVSREWESERMPSENRVLSASDALAHVKALWPDTTRITDASSDNGLAVVRRWTCDAANYQDLIGVVVDWTDAVCMKCQKTADDECDAAGHPYRYELREPAKHLAVYVGPYYTVPKDFDWKPWDGIVTACRMESGHDDDRLVLLPVGKVADISRDMTFVNCEHELTQINPGTIVRNAAACSRHLADLIDACDEVNVDIREAWGVVPYLSGGTGSV